MRRPAFTLIRRGGLQWLECGILSRLPWVLHAFSTRRGGASQPPAAGLNLGFTESDQRATVEKNRKRWLQQLGAQRFALAHLRQVHSPRVFEVVREPGGELEYRPGDYPAPQGSGSRIPEADALLTRESSILLSVRVADCMPILLADPTGRAVAAVHAGWRGALAGIVEIAVGEMVRVYGSRPRELVVAIGPSIRACCYQVGDEVVNAFCGRYANGDRFFCDAPHDKTEAEFARRYPLLFLSKKPPGHGPDAASTKHLDLVAVARDQLRRAGVSPSKIHVADYCTACRPDLFFSHRKEGSGTGRMMGVIGIERLGD